MKKKRSSKFGREVLPGKEVKNMREMKRRRGTLELGMDMVRTGMQENGGCSWKKGFECGRLTGSRCDSLTSRLVYAKCALRTC